MELRTATADDLDSLADIACAAFPMDPQWDYRFPRRREYPQDHWTCTRAIYNGFLTDSGDANYLVKVITSKSNEDDSIVKPVALAIWQLQYFKEASISKVQGECEWRQDADPNRMEAFTEALIKAKQTYFDDVYGDSRVHLRVLGTHPEYQRRGAATQLCQWGMTLARERNMAVTLFASPVGQQLYTHLGFKLVGTVTVQVEGEKEKLSIAVMVFENTKRATG
ncbi:MAG: hypothetical protein FRX48_02747 [Lasallia pustulata]|uniref:N-acetyltransferase domain-containing protein n=1 Tax=Lasallia pustulata TaxID=136370 RepID=A0A5M8PVE9_9LECA|nr:MAG: hypothetical protein FRX48_02747 [Lasallia pustulata]